MQEIIVGLGALVVFGLIARFQQTRLGNLDEKKTDKEMCTVIQKGFKGDLEKGEKKFEKIEEKLDKQALQLNTIVERVSFIAEKNGFGK